MKSRPYQKENIRDFILNKIITDTKIDPFYDLIQRIKLSVVHSLPVLLIITYWIMI